ncbi:type I secretion system permease/ATPase [Desulfobacter curvatus]|uniref:type I secretion system permease/ATPase n=1 Tax=Desulfobacter curvatus TaxID=2290 RepID=UPI00035E22EE|nr:ATP-binding cassette domain-containing protein [Desulfobacter curvatus]
MQYTMKSWLKYFLFAGIFNICLNVVYLSVPFYIMIVYDRALYSFSRSTLYTLSAGVLICLVVTAMFDYLKHRLMDQAGNDVVQHLNSLVFNQMHKDAAVPGGDADSGGLSDLNLIRRAIVQGRISSVLDFPWILIYLAVLYLIHPLPGMIGIGVVFLVAVFQILVYILEKRNYTIADVIQQSNQKFADKIFSHAYLIQSMRMGPAAERKYRERERQGLKMAAGADFFQSLAGAAIRMIHMIGPTAVFCAGAFVFFDNEITVGGIFAGAMVAVKIFQSLDNSLTNLQPAVQANAAWQRIKHRVEISAQREKLSLPEPEGRLDVNQLNLVIQGRPMLYNVTFSLEPGESLGIFGPSPVGKTSLCRALVGVWPIAAGEVRLDKAKISDWPDRQLAQYLGYMPQEPELLPGTVVENIARFAKDADSEKVVKAAKSAGVHEAILKMPKGYDTHIVADGANLSPGQRQIISLARTLYNDPRLVILDEPFTHMDDIGIKQVAATLNHLKQSKITHVMVTRQVGFLAKMDKVLILKEGKVAMYGPSKAVFAQLAKQQQAANGVVPLSNPSTGARI